jgi:methyl coenzyme M reductase gamma subunit
MSEVAHENELKKVKTIYRFHKLVFHGDKSSPECFNRAHKTVGCGSWFQSDIIQGKRKILVIL